MDRPDIPLNALRVFEVAMRQGSFTRAAVELRVSQAAVSHQVARLEDRLGAKLFQRTPGGLIPTDEGHALFPVLEHGFDAMAKVLDRLGGKREREILNVGVVTTFAVGWLIPRLSTFQAAHPDIEVRVATNNNRVKILREGLDMAIRFGSGHWSGCAAESLIEPPFSPLCSPALAAELHHPEDLYRQVLLRSYRGDEWAHWFGSMGVVCPPVCGPVLDSSVALADLAQDSHGVALLPVAMFSRRIADGRLAQPFEASVQAGQYYLCWPEDRRLTPPMAEFKHWLHLELSEGDNGVSHREAAC